MTGNTAFVPNLLAMAFRFRQRKVPSGTSIYHTRTPSQRQNQNSQSRRVCTARAVGLAPAIPSTRTKGGWNKKGASVEAPIGLNFPCGKGERIARTPTSASIPRHDDMSTPKAPKKEAPVGNGGVMTGNTAHVPSLLGRRSISTPARCRQELQSTTPHRQVNTKNSPRQLVAHMHPIEFLEGRDWYAMVGANEGGWKACPFTPRVAPLRAFYGTAMIYKL